MLLPVWQRVHPPTPVPEVVEAIQSYTSDTNKFYFPAHKNSEITSSQHKGTFQFHFSQVHTQTQQSTLNDSTQQL